MVIYDGTLRILEMPPGVSSWHLFWDQKGVSLVWCFHRRGQDSKRARKYKITWKKTKSTWWFKVTFLGWLSDPFKGLSDLQLGDEKGTLNHLARKNFRWVELESEIFFKFHYLTSSGGQLFTEVNPHDTPSFLLAPCWSTAWTSKNCVFFA